MENKTVFGSSEAQAYGIVMAAEDLVMRETLAKSSLSEAEFEDSRFVLDLLANILNHITWPNRFDHNI